MPLSGGTFTRNYDWTDDRDGGVKIRADRSDEELDDVATALSLAYYRDGQAVPTANLPMGSFKITGLGTPTADGDAATKAYVDSAVTPQPRITARVATTANITIATALNNGDTLDGVVLATNDIVLVKNQTTATQNGVYIVSASPARSTAADTWDEHVGLIVAVTAGTVGVNTLWVSMVNAGGTLDSTDITFAPSGATIETPVPLSLGGLGTALVDPDTDRIPFWDDSAGQMAWLAPTTGISITTTALNVTTATTSAAGIAELATSAETITGTDTARTVTPAGGAAAYEPLGKFIGLNTQTVAYTLVLADAGKNVEINSASAKQVTIPTNASVAYSTNTYINITRYGSGAVTVKGNTGVTLNGVSAGTVTIGAQYGGVTIYKRGTNEWVAPNMTAT